MTSHPPAASASAKAQAFSLVELLVVMGILGIAMVIVLPAVSGIQTGSGLTSTAHRIADTLSLAREYALAHNTYVWAGIDEVSQSSGASGPLTDGVGRVVASIVASKDGTRIYDVNGDISSDWASKTQGGAGLTQITKLIEISHAHLTTLSPGASSSGMNRPPVDPEFQIASAQAESALSLVYPLSATPATARQTFTKIIEISPEGTARLLRQANPRQFSRRIEIGLIPTKGETIVEGPNQAAVQIDSLSGATAVFRP